jgi:hypothetical protein
VLDVGGYRLHRRQHEHVRPPVGGKSRSCGPL